MGLFGLVMFVATGLALVEDANVGGLSNIVFGVLIVSLAAPVSMICWASLQIFWLCGKLWELTLLDHSISENKVYVKSKRFM